MNSKTMPHDAESKGSLMLEGREPDAKYALVSFVSKGKGELLVKISRAYQAVGHIIMLGQGTARSEILEYLGLELDEKEIIISHIRADQAQAALQALRHKMEMDRPGHGIAFLIPILDSKGLKAIFRLADQVSESGAEHAIKPDPALVPDQGILFHQHDLIIAALQTDIVEKAMAWARAAGAAGGTILHGRGGNGPEPDGLYGMLAKTGRELLLMLVRKNKTQPILKTLHERLEIKDDHKNVIFVLPVCAMGLAHRLIVQEDGSVTEQTYHV